MSCQKCNLAELTLVRVTVCIEASLGIYCSSIGACVLNALSQDMIDVLFVNVVLGTASSIIYNVMPSRLSYAPQYDDHVAQAPNLHFTM